MQITQKYIILVFLLFIGSGIHAQSPKIDKLEMFFAQKHYRKVYRRSTRLMDNPEYDFSKMPLYYKSISLLQLSQNDHWLSRHPKAIDDAKIGLISVRKSASGKAIFKAHLHELSWVKEDLMSWASDLKRMNNETAFSDVQAILNEVFEHVFVEENSEVIENPTVTDLNSGTDSRSKIVRSAEQHIGTPYVWAGSSPDGFDCSGFTSYVLIEFGIQLPRRAAEQYKMAKKIKKREAQKGDLVFFKNGNSISHVGIIISEKGEPLVMIHSSSSRGIIETNIENSDYWSKRLYSFGSVLSF